MRRRSATPIPPYEPPAERFTPPREVICTPPGAPPSPTRMTKSSKRKSTGTRASGKKLVLVIKKEPPEVDLTLPPPPPSPTDDPLLLKGGEHARRRKSRSHASHTRDTPPLGSSLSPIESPLPELHADVSLDGGAADWGTDDSEGPIEPAFQFDANDVVDDTGVWDDSGDDEDDGADSGFDQTGEYTGRFKVLTVPLKADPPSSSTKARQVHWGNPVSPFPGGTWGRAMPGSSSPPLKASPEVEEREETLQEEDVLILDGSDDPPLDGEETESTVDDAEERPAEQSTTSTDLRFSFAELTRSPSPPTPMEPERVIQPEADGEKQEQEDVVMRDASPYIPHPPLIDSSFEEDEGEDVSMSMSFDQPITGSDAEDDDSDAETVDRELSRPPDSDSDDEDAPPPVSVLTPPRATSPVRISEHPTSPPVRPKGFLSITSPLRRQKSPTWSPGRDMSPLPSIQSLLPATLETLAPIASTSQHTLDTLEVPDAREDVDDRMKDDVVTELDEDSASIDSDTELDDGVIKITSGDPRAAARAAAILKKVLPSVSPIPIACSQLKGSVLALL